MNVISIKKTNNAKGELKFHKYAFQKRWQRVGKKVLLIICGFLIGITNGFFGAGGGMLAVPVLTYVSKLQEKNAHATAIAVMLPLCIISTVVYAVSGNFNSNILLPTISGVVLGGILGAVMLKKIKAEFLNILFYGLMLFAGLKMLK